MVLVDTSVWIRALAGQTAYRSKLDLLLSRDEVAGHELIYGELLIGDRGGRVDLLNGYQRMRQARIVPHADVVTFVRERKLHGRGAGWIDIHLLASAMVERFQLWTADPRLDSLAVEFGVAENRA